MDDEEFLNSLKSDENKKEYREKVSQLRRDLNQGGKRKKEADRLLEEIRISERHDQLTSMAIVPFLTNSKAKELGYRFIRCAPLLEKGVKNLDFLIFKDHEKRPIAIFGEAKSSISKPNEIIKEFLERKKEIAKYRNYILEKYLKTKKDTIFEYVLCVFSRDAIKMKTAIEENNGGIILWSADLGLMDLTLVASSDSKMKTTMLHADHDLCNALNQLRTSLKSALHYVQSHIVIRLRSLIITKDYVTAIRDDKSQRFNREDLDFYLKKTLFYLPKELQDKETEHLISIGKEFEIIKEVDGSYLIATKARGTKGQTKEIGKTWISSKVKRKEEKTMEERLEELQNEIISKDKKQTSIDEFPN